MDSTIRAKHSKGNLSLVKPHSNSPCNLNKEWMVPLKYDEDVALGSNSNPNFDLACSVMCTKNQLEEILKKNMEIICKDIVSKLVALGYNEDAAVKSILQFGDFFGGKDVASNILQNSMNCLKKGYLQKSGLKPKFSNLRQYEESTLTKIVSLLQEERGLSRGDAMWCLLMSNFHIGKASTIQISIGNQCLSSNVIKSINVENEEGLDFSTNMFYRGLQLQRDIEFPKRFNLSSSMKFLLNQNVATFVAGYKANPKYSQIESKDFLDINVTSKLDSSSISRVSRAMVFGEQFGEIHNMHGQDDMLHKFLDLNIDEMVDFVPDDEKDVVIVSLVRQIKDLEKQVKERKDWAYQKAIQAARKLSNNLIEQKKLKLEREKNKRLENKTYLLRDTTLKKISEVENTLRKANGQMDQVNAIVKRVEMENTEIKAELEASKLSALESVTSCLQIAKREKRCLRRLTTLEKQKDKIQQDISNEKQKILEIQEEIARIKHHETEVEVIIKEELKAQEEALALIEQEYRSKETVEANNQRNLKALCLKVETDSQRRKDDLLRLEQEMSRLKASAQSKDVEPQRETIAKLLQELDNVEAFSGKEVKGNRECIACRKDDVSMIFLPCAHQVMCASCGEEYGRNGKVVCPCCRVSIQQKIRVFGASS
ncbi:hypothetical protein RJT34_05584 [Clitoria ternatea]|uniref:RING-type domain-containing protein n=1 Tax=Clitoria ternatea TaxID=43366 RepID=A0AAN9K193_CLITE